MLISQNAIQCQQISADKRNSAWNTAYLVGHRGRTSKNNQHDVTSFYSTVYRKKLLRAVYLR